MVAASHVDISSVLKRIRGIRRRGIKGERRYGHKVDDLMHKSSSEVRANLKRAADAELERIGFHKLRQAVGANTAGGPQ